MPKISVIMPAYNAEKYIAEAIDSILGQTYGDFEVIILNDCSKDRTEEIILSYKDPRIVYLKNEQNMGVAATLNRGLEAAKGEYIARMDADDIALPERLKKQAMYLDTHMDISVLGCSIERFSDKDNLGTRKFAHEADLMAIDMLFACGLAHPSVMMRTQVIRDLGGYDTEFNGLEDYELWCRVLEEHKIAALPDVLLRYRIHSGQVTQNPSPQYLQRMHQLKKRQIHRLGVDPALMEEFFSYCVREKLETVEKVKGLDDFFALIDKANKEKHIFNEENLQKSFRSVIRSCAAQTSFVKRYYLSFVCRYLKMYEMAWFMLKLKAKKLIKSIRR